MKEEGEEKEELDDGATSNIHEAHRCTLAL
jgi:hypothetical protein